MINITIRTQPDDETCGPTCLHAIYQYYGVAISLEEVIATVERSASGGTLSPLLAKHALEHGFSTTIYINNLEVFDPTWFHDGESDNDELINKLTLQLKYKNNPGLVQLSVAYLHYLHLGGKVRFEGFNSDLLKHYFNKDIPILTGLSATYLYNCSRESTNEHSLSVFDDVRGTPCGHFVILCGYDAQKSFVVVADPHRENPLSHDYFYQVHAPRLLSAIMLGVLTYDANLLIIQPKDA